MLMTVCTCKLCQTKTNYIQTFLYVNYTNVIMNTYMRQPTDIQVLKNQNMYMKSKYDISVMYIVQIGTTTEENRTKVCITKTFFSSIYIYFYHKWDRWGSLKASGCFHPGLTVVLLCKRNKRQPQVNLLWSLKYLQAKMLVLNAYSVVF